jgi:two-component system sensor histidine kinase GlrK
MHSPVRDEHHGSVLGFLRPRSFMSLILLALLVLALPLLAALTSSSVQVGKLARQSQDAVYRSVRATQDGRILVELVTSMERNARQFLVLQDESRLAAYAQRHGDFQDILRDMFLLNTEQAQRDRLSKLGKKERTVFAVLSNPASSAEDSRDAVVAFAELGQLARAILAESSRVSTDQVDVLRGMAGKARQLLFWQAFALIPLAIACAALLFVLISRSVRQIDQAIKGLGDADYHSPVRISGPRDVEDLGKRLDWLRERLLALEEEKTRFLRHISHELKTPLTAVREGSELLAGKVLGPLNEHQLEAADILRHNTLRLQKLIEDLLAFNRLVEAREAYVVEDELSLDQLVGNIASDYRLAVRKKSLALDLQLQPVHIRGDTAKLRAIIDNLLSNAVKYSPVGGTVAVTLARDDDSVRLEVSDEGPGVAASDRERIFDAFYQGSTQPTGPVRGTGLGLAIARECARAHGGELAVVGEGGEGTRFRTTLPFAPRGQAA